VGFGPQRQGTAQLIAGDLGSQQAYVRHPQALLWSSQIGLVHCRLESVHEHRADQNPVLDEEATLLIPIFDCEQSPC
jgi:hypothetical protein